MKSINFIFFSLILSAILISCNGSGGKVEETTEVATEDSAEGASEEVQQVTAKFVEFNLGDASHFIFEDESGTSWDFAGNDDPNFAFAQELPEDQANETNQGWTSDKALQGKWFIISYVYREQPQYQDGPMVSVPVIVKVEPRQ